MKIRCYGMHMHFSNLQLFHIQIHKKLSQLPPYHLLSFQNVFQYQIPCAFILLLDAV